MKISMVVSGDARGGARDRLGGRGTGFLFFSTRFLSISHTRDGIRTEDKD